MKLESLHTAPHPIAPHPEWWHAPDSDSTECEVTELVAAFVRAIQPEIVVETGTAFGYTAVAIGRALLRNGHGKLYTLEPNPQRRMAATALARQELFDERDREQFIEFLPNKSLNWTPPGEIQFAWFDSLYELRVKEFLCYHQLGCLKQGTIVGFHDWTSGVRRHHLDIQQEIERYLVKPGYLKVIYVPTPRGVALGEVIR